MPGKRPTTARLLQVLLFMDEPHVILLSTESTSLIIAVAAPKSDALFNDPYFGAEITQAQFRGLVAERYDLRYVMERAKHKSWYIIDLDHLKDGKVPLYRLKIKDKIPAEYLPGIGLFAREFTEPVTQISGASFSTEVFSIDGAWDFPDFSKFYARFADLYFIFNSVDVFLDEVALPDRRRAIVEAFIKPWRGGGSYKAFYDGLIGVQDENDRLTVGSIKYASPGHIDVRGRDGPFGEVRALMERVDVDANGVGDAYRELYAFLSHEKLLRLPPDRFNRHDALGKEVMLRTIAFSETLKAVSFDVLMEMAGGDQLIAAKVLLSIYRRLASLREFFDQGRLAYAD